MNLVTGRLFIRDLKPEDASPFAEMAADGSLNDIGFPKDCGKWMADFVIRAKKLSDQNNPDTRYLAYAIECKEESRVIGSVGCSYYEDLKETGLTYFLGAAYRNQGYALEAVKAYTDYFLKSYPGHKLIATIREANGPSWRLVEKLGFQLVKVELYQDINDIAPKPYRFYRLEASHFPHKQSPGMP